MPTEKQKKAVGEIVENSRNKGEALLNAGYSKNTSIKPSQVTESKGFKEVAKPFLDKAESERQRLIDSMTNQALDKVTYNHKSEAIARLTKDIQLLGGKPTEIIETELDEDIKRARAELEAARTSKKEDTPKEPSKELHPKWEDSRIH